MTEPKQPTEAELVGVTSLACRLKTMGLDPVTILRDAVKAEEWFRDNFPWTAVHDYGDDLGRAAEAIKKSNDSLNHTDSIDALDSLTVRYKLRMMRVKRLLQTETEPHDLDAAAAALSLKQERRGRRRLPLFVETGLVAEFDFFEGMRRQLEHLERQVPTELKEVSEILAFLAGPGRPPAGGVNEWEHLYRSFARELSRFRKDRGKGRLTLKQRAELLLLEHLREARNDPRPVEDQDHDEAHREVDHREKALRRGGTAELRKRRRREPPGSAADMVKDPSSRT